MASPITKINPRGINTTGDYVVNSLSSTGNVTAGNIKTDHLLYANGTPYVFTTNAAGTNTQIQFNDGNSFAGSANLTFNKTTGTLTTNFFVGNGSQLTGLPASYTDTNANSAIDARVTKTFVDNLGINANTINGHSDTYFATSTQGSLADSAVQPDDLATVATSGSYTDLTNKPTLFDGEYASLANKPSLFDGTYANLTGKPSLFDGEYSSLANKPTLFSGSYADLTNKPTLGTAAATDANAYATAAQGAKADTALQAANLVGYATESYVGNSIANLVASAPAALDTLNELANALGNDASYSTTITNQLANKLSTSNFASTANTWISTQSTSNLAEGSNLYYTVARANTAIDARVTKSFVDNLSVVANIANVAYSVSGSNVSGPVAYAAIANSVSASNVVGQVANSLVSGTVYTNAQPNITSVGTLTSLTVSGNASAGNLTLSGASNLHISGGSNGQVLTATATSGVLAWTTPTVGTLQDVTTNGGTTTESISITNESDATSYTNGALVVAGGIGSGGNIRANGRITTETTFYAGYQADSSVWTAPKFIGREAGATFIQGALINTSNTGSADWVSYGDQSDDGMGWMDMGFTGTEFDDTNYTITKASDGYIFSQGMPDQGGNLVIATGPLGGTTHRDIVFATGGFLEENESMRLNHEDNTFYVGGHGDSYSNVVTNLDVNGNIFARSKLSVSSANLKVTGGTSGQVLSTDGNGNLSWTSSATSSETSVSLDSFTGDGANTSFTLSVSPANVNMITVNYNGSVLLKDSYSVSGNVLTLGSAPFNGSKLEVISITNLTGSSSGSSSGPSYTYAEVTANTTMVASTKYIVNTTSANITLTLPSTGTLGDEISVIDGTGNASTHAITIARNGGKIQGDASDMTVTTNRAAFTLVYYNSNQGWLLTNV
jgi:hypothetical protein